MYLAAMVEQGFDRIRAQLAGCGRDYEVVREEDLYLQQVQDQGLVPVHLHQEVDVQRPRYAQIEDGAPVAGHDRSLKQYSFYEKGAVNNSTG